jgi:hypothetical protein
LLCRRRRANDGAAVHMHVLEDHAAESPVRDCRFRPQTRRLGDATSPAAGCRPEGRCGRTWPGLPLNAGNASVSAARTRTLMLSFQSSRIVLGGRPVPLGLTAEVMVVASANSPKGSLWGRSGGWDRRAS